MVSVIESFTNIDQSVAYDLIARKQQGLILSYLDNFNISSPSDLVAKIIERQPDKLFPDWSAFIKDNNLDYNKIAHGLLVGFRGDVILENRKKFENIDYSEIASGLLRSGQHEMIINYWDDLKSYIDKEALVETILNQKEYHLIFKAVIKLGITDKTIVLNQLESDDKYYEILSHISLFPEEEIAKIIFEKDKVHKIDEESIIENFQYLSSDIQRNIINKFINEGRTEIIKKNFGIVFGLNMEQINTLGNMYPSHYNSLFQSINRQSLNTKDVESLLQRSEQEYGDEFQVEIVSKLFSQYYYQELETVVNASSLKHLENTINAIHPSLVTEAIKDMYSHGNYESVGSLINIAKLLNIDIQESQNNLDLTQLKSEVSDSIENRKHYEYVDINKELAKFYLDEFIRVETFGLRTALKYGLFEENDPQGRNKLEGIKKQQDLEFLKLEDRILYRRLENDGSNQIDNMFKLFREYLLVACQSEMSNQERETNLADNIMNNGVYRYSYDTSENIRLYFTRCRDQFNDPGWSYNYAGKPWANIADCGIQIWKDNLTEPEKIFLLDRIIDIHHNNGHIFDKDREKIGYISEDLTDFLDFRKNAKELETLLEYCLKNNYITEKEADEYVQKKDQLKRLRNFAATPVRREKSE